MKVFYNTEPLKDDKNVIDHQKFLGFLIDDTDHNTTYDAIKQLYTDVYGAVAKNRTENEWVSNMKKRGWTIEKKPDLCIFDLTFYGPDENQTESMFIENPMNGVSEHRVAMFNEYRINNNQVVNGENRYIIGKFTTKEATEKRLYKHMRKYYDQFECQISDTEIDIVDIEQYFGEQIHINNPDIPMLVCISMAQKDICDFEETFNNGVTDISAEMYKSLLKIAQERLAKEAEEIAELEAEEEGED